MSSIVQSNTTGDTAVSAPYTLAFSGAVTSGNLLVCLVRYVGTGVTAASTFSDSVNGGWGTTNRLHVYDATVNRAFSMAWKPNTGAGTPTVTVTLASGTNSGMISIFELDITGTDLTATSATHIHTATASTHPCADAPGLSYPSGAVVLAGGVPSGSTSGTTAATNYTKTGPNHDQCLFQYRIASGAVVDDQATWANSGSARAACSAMVAFSQDAAPPPPEPSTAFHGPVFTASKFFQGLN